MEQDNAAFFLCKPTEELQLKSELAIIIFPCCVGSSFSVAEIITFVLLLFKLQVEFVASVQLWGAARRVRAWAGTAQHVPLEGMKLWFTADKHLQYL